MTHSASQRIAITGTTRLRRATSQRNQHTAHQGLNARRSLARLQLSGEIFLLTFPLREPQGGQKCSGPRAISMAHWLVNTHVTAADLTLNNDTGPMLRIRPVSDIDCK